MSVVLIFFGLLAFTLCIGLYLVELALHLERSSDDPDLNLEALLDLDNGPHAGIVIDLAEHQIRTSGDFEGFDDVA